MLYNGDVKKDTVGGGRHLVLENNNKNKKLYILPKAKQVSKRTYHQEFAPHQ